MIETSKSEEQPKRGIRKKPLTDQEKTFRSLLKHYNLTETDIATVFGYSQWRTFYNSSAREHMMHGISGLIEYVKHHQSERYNSRRSLYQSAETTKKNIEKYRKFYMKAPWDRF